MACYRMTIAFCGTAYCGWQVQQNARSVCETFQDAVEAVLGERGSVKGCSRTDSGVHANGFVLALYCAALLPPQGLLRGLNAALPRDIAVRSCETAPERFHPRYDCTAKRYLYKIHDAPVRSPFLADRALHWPHPLDVPALSAACGAFLGRHDFSAFCAAGGSIPPDRRERTVTQCALSRAGDCVEFSVTGDGFLYNMVRIMTGTLLDISSGRIDSAVLGDIIQSKERSRAGFTAPPQGLYLDRVFYD